MRAMPSKKNFPLAFLISRYKISSGKPHYFLEEMKNDNYSKS